MKQKPWWGYTAREMTRVVRTQLAEDGTGGGSGVQIGAPVSPVDGDAWIEVSGTTPNRSIALKYRDGGNTVTIAEVTV